jgi:hypothetical protein
MPDMTSADMKKHLAQTKTVSTAEGLQVVIKNAGGAVHFAGKDILDPKDVPTDEEIAKHRQSVAEARKLLK